ncbi:MAG: hypothetical protein D6709_01685, partial [Chloroflexi bacterium]
MWARVTDASTDNWPLDGVWLNDNEVGWWNTGETYLGQTDHEGNFEVHVASARPGVFALEMRTVDGVSLVPTLYVTFTHGPPAQMDL